MFSEKMEKIEQNMISMFDKLLETPGQDVNSSIQNATQSILQNRFKYKPTRVNQQLEMLSSLQVDPKHHKYLENDHAQKVFAYNQYLSRVKNQSNDSSHALLIKAHSSKDGTITFQERGKQLMKRAKKISMMSDHSHVSSLLINNNNATSFVKSNHTQENGVSEEEQQVNQVSQPPSRQEILINEAVLRNSYLRNNEPLNLNSSGVAVGHGQEQPVKVQIINPGNVSQTSEKFGAASRKSSSASPTKVESRFYSNTINNLCEDQNQHSIDKVAQSPGSGAINLSLGHQTPLNKNKQQYDLKNISEKRCFEGLDRVRSDKINTLQQEYEEGCALPSNRVVIVESNNQFEDEPIQLNKQQFAAETNGHVLKSQSNDHGSTDVNHSHVLSDHLTNKMVPMSIQEIQQTNDEYNRQSRSELHQHSEFAASKFYQKRVNRDSSFGKVEAKQKQSRYLLRNQRMRLFSPIFKSKYQNHEMHQLRQSEQLDRIENDADSLSGSVAEKQAENLFSMLRVFRAISPTQQKQRQLQLMNMHKHKNQKSQQLVQMNINLKMREQTIAQDQGQNMLIGANVIINGVPCKQINTSADKEFDQDNDKPDGEEVGSTKTAKKIGHRHGVLSFRNDLNSLKQSKEIYEVPNDQKVIVNVGFKSPQSSNQKAQPELPHSFQDSYQKREFSDPSETKLQLSAQFVNNSENTKPSLISNKQTKSISKNVRFEPLNYDYPSQNLVGSDNAVLQYVQGKHSYLIDSGKRRVADFENQDKLSPRVLPVAQNQPQFQTQNSPLSMTVTPLKAINIVDGNSLNPLLQQEFCESRVDYAGSLISINQDIIQKPCSKLTSMGQSPVDGVETARKNSVASHKMSTNNQNSDLPKILIQNVSDSTTKIKCVKEQVTGVNVSQNTLDRHTALQKNDSFQNKIRYNQGQQQQFRQNIDEIVMTSLRESPLKQPDDILVYNRNCAMESYQGVAQVKSKTVGGTESRKKNREVVNIALSHDNNQGFANNNISGHQNAPMATFRNQVAPNPINYMIYEQNSRFRNTLVVERNQQQGVNNSYSGNSMSQSFESFNTRIKAVQRTDSIAPNMIKNVDLGYKKQQQIDMPSSINLQSQNPTSQIYKIHQKYKQKKEASTHNDYSSNGANKLNFEAAIWTEVQQQHGPMFQKLPSSLSNTQLKDTKVINGIQYQQSIINQRNSTSTTGALHITTQAEELKGANLNMLGVNYELQNKSASPSPFVSGDARREVATHGVRSPLRLWKEMNEDNWNKIKSGGYVPIPLKSTKSANLTKRVHNSQLSTIRPVLNNEQLSMHVQQMQNHQIQADTQGCSGRFIQGQYQQILKSVKLADQLRRRKKGVNHKLKTATNSTIMCMDPKQQSQNKYLLSATASTQLPQNINSVPYSREKQFKTIENSGRSFKHSFLNKTDMIEQDEQQRQLDIVSLIPTSINLFNTRGLDPGGLSMRHENAIRQDDHISASSRRQKHSEFANPLAVWNSLDVKTDTLQIAPLGSSNQPSNNNFLHSPQDAIIQIHDSRSFVGQDQPRTDLQSGAGLSSVAITPGCVYNQQFIDKTNLGATIKKVDNSPLKRNSKSQQTKRRNPQGGRSCIRQVKGQSILGILRDGLSKNYQAAPTRVPSNSQPNKQQISRKNLASSHVSNSKPLSLMALGQATGSNRATAEDTAQIAGRKGVRVINLAHSLSPKSETAENGGAFAQMKPQLDNQPQANQISAQNCHNYQFLAAGNNQINDNFSVNQQDCGDLIIYRPEDNQPPKTPNNTNQMILTNIPIDNQMMGGGRSSLLKTTNQSVYRNDSRVYNPKQTRSDNDCVTQMTNTANIIKNTTELVDGSYSKNPTAELQEFMDELQAQVGKQRKEQEHETAVDQVVTVNQLKKKDAKKLQQYFRFNVKIKQLNKVQRQQVDKLENKQQEVTKLKLQ